MSDSRDALARQLGAASDLKSVVRAMKALAASSLGQYEKAVASLRDYYRTIELGLIACLGLSLTRFDPGPVAGSGVLGIVLFGSDQGLVGQFNESLVEYFRQAIAQTSRVRIWAIGERVAAAAADKGYTDVHVLEVPNSIQSIGTLIGHLCADIQRFQSDAPIAALHVFHHGPSTGTSYEPQSRRLMPVDRAWIQSLEATRWPTHSIPQTIAPAMVTFAALVREYLFVCLFQACAESLASENASRLMGMQRAEKNIDELSGTLRRRFQQLRQSAIDEELFDVISGFESLSSPIR